MRDPIYVLQTLKRQIEYELTRHDAATNHTLFVLDKIIWNTMKKMECDIEREERLHNIIMNEIGHG